MRSKMLGLSGIGGSGFLPLAIWVTALCFFVSAVAVLFHESSTVRSVAQVFFILCLAEGILGFWLTFRRKSGYRSSDDF